MASGAELDVNIEDDDDDVLQVVRKKHKKGKHKKDKKHKKRKDRGRFCIAMSDDEDPDGNQTVSRKRSRATSVQDTLTSPGVKLKIKFGGQTMATAAAVEMPSAKRSRKPAPVVQSDSDENTDYDNWRERSSKRARNVGKVVRDDEDEWLEALEAGELNERGGIMKYPAMTTARQRAMMGSDSQQQLLELPSGRTPDREMTEEMQARKNELARKRRQREARKREEQKKNTVKKLITKPAGARKKDDKQRKSKYADRPTVRYISNTEGFALSFPPGMDFPLKAQRAQKPPDKALCSVEGCTNMKRYTSSRTLLPVCSLECYKKV